jgi:hypothetical protein
MQLVMLNLFQNGHFIFFSLFFNFYSQLNKRLIWRTASKYSF